LPSAEIIAIGTELLLGEVQDTNTTFLASQLRKYGMNVFRTTMIGDNPTRISEVIKESLIRADFIITTGGLGPTVDDPTRDAVAAALGVKTIFDRELWAQIKNRFKQRGVKPTKNNRKQAYIPQGTIPIPNPVGTAPAFYFLRNGKLLVSLPGVPGEVHTIFFKSIIPLINATFQPSEIIKTLTLRCSGISESLVDELIAAEEIMSNPTVGLCAYPGIVDVRITAKAASETLANEMIFEVESRIREKLDSAIFGINSDSLFEAIEQQLSISNLSAEIHYFVAIQEIETISIRNNSPLLQFLHDTDPLQIDISPRKNKKLVFGVNLTLKENIFVLKFFDYQFNKTAEKSFSGAYELVETWFTNTTLELTRKAVISFYEGEHEKS
jgi:nicotinamide-nucleotide amidase